MKTLIIWLMVQPGVWDEWKLELTQAECDRNEAVLIKIAPKYKLNNKKRQRAHIRKIYNEGAAGPGFFWFGCR